MKNLLSGMITGVALLGGIPAIAQVEPQFAGDWQLAPESGETTRSLHVDGSGRYQIVSNGQVHDSGTINMSDGSWKLKSNTGSRSEGRYSLVNGKLKLYGGGLAGKWERPSGMAQARTSVANSLVPAGNSLMSSGSPVPLGGAQQGYSPMAGGVAVPLGHPSSSQGNTPQVQTAPDFRSQSGNHPAYTRQQPGYNIPGSHPQQELPGYNPAAYAGQPKKGNYVPTSTPHSQPGVEYRTVRPGAYISKIWNPDGIQTNKASEWSPEQNHQVPGKQYPTSAPANWTPPVNPPIYSNPPLTGTAASNGYQYPAEQRKTDFNTWSKVQEQFAGMRGPRPVPQGGYIPVMKDNKARRFFKGF
jgi:hypothetical protein